MARVFFDRISKRFGDTYAVHDLTLEIGDDEFFVLLGPSGCGKTTALRMVAGLEEATEGEIFIGERNVTDVPAKDRDLAMVFQNYALYPHMSVYDNIAFGLRMRKYSNNEIDGLVRETAKTLGIDEFLKRRPGQLSGGQRQRVALGRAIVRRPLAFLMDEPLSNLDSKMRVQMRAELIRLHREVDQTFIYVTHDQVEAMTMGQRVAVLDRGRLQQVGSPQEVYDRPANLFVAAFIGSPAMNLVEGELGGDEGAPVLKVEGVDVQLAEALAAQLAKSTVTSVTVGLRPEHLAVEVPDPAATFEGTVELVEALGSEQHVTVKVGGSSLIAKLPASPAVEHGSRMRVSVAKEHVQLFNAATEERIGP